MLAEHERVQQQAGERREDAGDHGIQGAFTTVVAEPPPAERPHGKRRHAHDRKTQRSAPHEAGGRKVGFGWRIGVHRKSVSWETGNHRCTQIDTDESGVALTHLSSESASFSKPLICVHLC